MRDPGTNRITSYFHCGQCLEEKPDDESPLTWARFSVGMTEHGTVQVWCVRHDRGVVEVGGMSGGSGNGNFT